MSGANKTGLTPIGVLQQQAKKFFSSSVGLDIAAAVHVPTIGILLDFHHGLARPCDSAPFQYRAESWGKDFLQ